MTFDEQLTLLQDVVDAIKSNHRRRGNTPTANDINDELWKCLPAVTAKYRPHFEAEILRYIGEPRRIFPSTEGHSKPHGVMGYDVVGGSSQGHVTLAIPQSKEGKEKFATENFLRSPVEGERGTAAELLKVDKWKLNPMDALDVHLDTKNGPKQLELMEVAPLELYRTTYDKAPNRHDRLVFAKAVWAKIEKKSRNYGRDRARDICLLLYITEDKFHMSGRSMRYLQHRLLSEKHAFEAVFYTPTMTGIPSTILYLDDKDWMADAKAALDDFDEDSVRGEVINLVGLSDKVRS